MKRPARRRRFLLFLAAIAALTTRAVGQSWQLGSAIDTNQPAPPGAAGDSMLPIPSADGRYVLFASTANNLSLTSSNTPYPSLFPSRLNVYMRDRTTGAATLVSVNTNGTSGGNGDSFLVDISTNNQYVLFESTASDLVAGDSNNVSDVFVRDLVNNTTLLVSVATNGLSGNSISRNAVMTPDGQFVAFVSQAWNLTPD